MIIPIKNHSSMDRGEENLEIFEVGSSRPEECRQMQQPACAAPQVRHNCRLQHNEFVKTTIMRRDEGNHHYAP